MRINNVFSDLMAFSDILWNFMAFHIECVAICSYIAHDCPLATSFEIVENYYLN